MGHSISVVVPAYNAEATISNTLQSILSQSSPPEEIIVVDDGSSDRTSEVAAKFGDAVRLFKQENQGAAVARQTGTDESQSEYIAYLDADDWWPIDKLEKCRHILRSGEIHFLFADLQRAHMGSGEEDYLPRNTSHYPWVKQYLNETTLTGNIPNLYRLDQEFGLSLIMSGFPVYPSTMLVRKAAVDQVGGWDSRFRRCQDFDIALRLARSFPLCFYNEVSAILGLHEGNSDEKPYVIKQSLGDILVLEKHVEGADDQHYVELASAALSRKYCGLGYTYRSVNDFENAKLYYKKAMHLPGKRIHAFVRYIVAALHGFGAPRA